MTVEYGIDEADPYRDPKEKEEGEEEEEEEEDSDEFELEFKDAPVEGFAGPGGVQELPLRMVPRMELFDEGARGMEPEYREGERTDVGWGGLRAQIRSQGREELKRVRQVGREEQQQRHAEVTRGLPLPTKSDSTPPKDSPKEIEVWLERQRQDQLAEEEGSKRTWNIRGWNGKDPLGLNLYRHGPPGGGIMVGMVNPGSVCATAGVKTGMLHSVAGMRVRTVEDVQEAVERVRKYKLTSFDIVLYGDPIAVSKTTVTWDCAEPLGMLFHDAGAGAVIDSCDPATPCGRAKVPRGKLHSVAGRYVSNYDDVLEAVEYVRKEKVKSFDIVVYRPPILPEDEQRKAAEEFLVSQARGKMGSISEDVKTVWLRRQYAAEVRGREPPEPQPVIPTRRQPTRQAQALVPPQRQKDEPPKPPATHLTVNPGRLPPPFSAPRNPRTGVNTARWKEPVTGSQRAPGPSIPHKYQISKQSPGNLMSPERTSRNPRAATTAEPLAEPVLPLQDGEEVDAGWVVRPPGMGGTPLRQRLSPPPTRQLPQ
eukprot:Hpha_TRINITY_DN8835_c0_g1::TRINITY_DN8835_c0_g1_i1::g.141620::m.141620